MHLWHATYDPAVRVHRHAMAKGFGHALLAPLMSHVFTALRVAAAVWEKGTDWFPIYSMTDVGAFESEHGIDTERGKYNSQCAREAIRRKRAVRGQHAGYTDLFVPVVARGQVVAVLVTGPFALRRPTSTEILERWRGLTGRQGHPADPEFASYLAASLSTLVLDDGKAAAFERMLGCLVRLMAGEGSAAALATQAAVLGSELEEARWAERCWDAVRTMVDERSSQTWRSAYRAHELGILGLSRIADHVLVGLTKSLTQGDPTDEAVRRHGLQRRCVELARTVGDVIAGQVGDHGVVFLSARGGTQEAKRRKLVDLSERVSAAAQKSFRLSAHFGASVASGSAPLSQSFQAALGAAQASLAQGVRIRMADAGATPHVSLWRLRKELASVLEHRPALVPPHFDRYLEVVAQHAAHRMDTARAHLEIAFERMAEAWIGRGALDEKSLEALREGLDRGAASARTIDDLFGEYRRAVADVALAAQQPAAAQRDRSLRRAVSYIQEHYTEPLRLEQVAAVAGFAPKYFSRLCAQREHVPFARYVVGLRLERAKQFLASTEIAIARVAELCGFGSPQYFATVFSKAMKMTPLAFRKEPETMRAAGKGAGRNSVTRYVRKRTHATDPER